MDSTALLVRRVLAALLVLIAVIGFYWLLQLGREALLLWQQMQLLPTWFRWSLLLLALAGFALGAWLLWGLLRPASRRAAKVESLDRKTIEARIAQLDALGSDTQPLREELRQLEDRATDRRLYVAIYGDISSGKTSLLRALHPAAEGDIDVRGGSTAEVSLHDIELGSQQVVLADVPGRQQVDGTTQARLAEEEAARAHVLVYVTDADLTRSQDADLRALARFDRPILLVLNKQDRYASDERATLLRHLQARYAPLGIEVMAVSAGFVEMLEKEWPDGRRERVSHPHPAQIDALRRALLVIAGEGAEIYESGRQKATLSHLEQRLSVQECEQRASEAERIVTRYTRRAIVAAMASVAPGTDLLLQGALATAMARELAVLHRLRVRDLDLDALVDEATKVVRTRTGIVLAIAGNALKAFPGLGTLGGGVMHAVAYGLIFDSLGRAMVKAFAETGRLDRSATLAAFESALRADSGSQIQRIAALAQQLVRDESAQTSPRSGASP